MLIEIAEILSPQDLALCHCQQYSKLDYYFCLFSSLDQPCMCAQTSQLQNLQNHKLAFLARIIPTSGRLGGQDHVVECL